MDHNGNGHKYQNIPLPDYKWPITAYGEVPAANNHVAEGRRYPQRVRFVMPPGENQGAEGDFVVFGATNEFNGVLR
jgi:hypothetical protein